MAATRKLVTALFLAVVFGACGGSAGGEGTTAVEDETPAQPQPVVQTDSTFCQKAADLGAEAEELEAEWATKEIDDVWEYWREVYGYFAVFYRELGSAAGSDLAGDFGTVIAGFETMSEWQGDLTVESPLSDAEESAMTASLENISQALLDECGMGDGGIDVELGGAEESSFTGVEGPPAGGVDTSSVSGRHVVQAAGETFEEDLTGEFDVECEIFDGFAVWLYGADFVTEAHANADGVGTHEAQIFVLSNLMEYDEAVDTLQEIDGTLTMDAWGDSIDGVRLVSGSFSAASADGSVSAEFTCLAWEG